VGQPAAATPVTPPTPANPAASAQTFTEQGEAAFKSGDYKTAVNSWRHALVDDNKNPVLLMMLGQGLFATGSFEESAGAVQAAMAQIPKDKWGVVVANHKDLYGNVQDYTNQLRTLETAIRDKPDNPALRFLAGYHYAYLGFPKESVDQLDKALKLEPRDEMSKALRDEMRSKLPQPVVPQAAPKPPVAEPPQPKLDGPSAWNLPANVRARLAA
jgi:tetratricopeptide (TPR) repeat protein